MTTIYTARNIVGNDKTTPLFSIKGLAHLAPSTLIALNVQGIALEKQVAYTQYAAHISSFIYATAYQRTITVSPRPLGLLQTRPLLPLDPPSVSFTLIKPLNSDQAEKLVNVLGPGANKTTSGKTTIYHAPSMPSSILPNVITISNDFFNAGRNSVNPRGLRAWNFISNVVSEFLKVHSYPAFRIEDPESLTAFEQLIGGESDGKYYPRTWTTKNEKGEEKAGQRDMVPASRTAVEEEKRKRDRSDAMTDDDDEDMPELENDAGKPAGEASKAKIEEVS